MDKERFEREKVYQLTMNAIRAMLRAGVLTQDEYAHAARLMAEKYRPVFGDPIADLA